LGKFGAHYVAGPDYVIGFLHLSGSKEMPDVALLATLMPFDEAPENVKKSPEYPSLRDLQFKRISQDGNSV
jgi:hypothetical protein